MHTAGSDLEDGRFIVRCVFAEVLKADVLLQMFFLHNNFSCIASA